MYISPGRGTSRDEIMWGLSVDGKIILKWILNIQVVFWGAVVGLTHRDLWWALLNMVMNLQVP
jgi:hypothetical protein